MSDSELRAVNQLLGESNVTIHLHDGTTISGEPYTVDVVGVVIQKGDDTNVVPWAFVKRVYFNNPD